MPANILKPDVLAIAPELSTIADGAWVEILAYVNEIPLSAFDDSVPTHRLARIFLAAHIGTVSKRAVTGAVGPVTAESAGGLRRSYGAVATSTDTSNLSSSMYGTQYMTILNASYARGPFLV